MVLRQAPQCHEAIQGALVSQMTGNGIARLVWIHHKLAAVQCLSSHFE